MNKLCIIPCSSTKIWLKLPLKGATEAKDVYTSPLAKLCKKYATMFFESWIILSAKHGYLFPNDLIYKDYYIAFKRSGKGAITVAQLKQQINEKSLFLFEDIVVLGGKTYCKVVQESFGNKNYSFPLSGCKGIGYMLQKLKFAINCGEEIET